MNSRYVSSISSLICISILSAIGYHGGADPRFLYVGAIALIASTLIGVRVFAVISPPSIPLTIKGATLTVILLWMFGSFHFSELPDTSFVVGLTIASMPLAYVTCILALRDDSTWFSSLSLVRAIALLVMAIGIVDFLLLRGRPFSVFQDVNVLAAFCNVFALPAIARLHERARTDGFAAAARSGTAWFLIAALACLAATSSRGGHLSFFFGVIVLGVLLIRHDRQAWKTMVASLAIFVALLALIAQFQNQAGSISRLAGINGDQSTHDRVEMLKSAWHMVEDGPWYGSGAGTYKVRYLMYRSPTELSTSGDLAHNDYLEFLAEGGPVLLLALLALALSVALAALRLWRSARRTAETSPHFIEAAGLVGALCCLFGHAALNFIFYVMPLAMIAGLYLGRLDNLRTDVRTVDPFRHVSLRMAILLLSGVALWLTGTIGLQSAFYAMTTGQCQLRMCGELSGDEKFYGRFSALLAATQPSYLPARDWFVNAYTATANSATDPAKRIEAARQAAKELSELISQYPALPYTYAQLGELLEKHPEAAKAIVPGVLAVPQALYTEALRRNPLDTTTRIRQAKMLDEQGQQQQAFSLVFDDGMRWWKVATLSDQGRMAMLQFAMPQALKLGRCKDAIEMSGGLSVFTPDDALVKSVAALGAQQPVVADGTANCGLPALPAPLPASG